MSEKRGVSGFDLQEVLLFVEWVVESAVYFVEVAAQEVVGPYQLC